VSLPGISGLDFQQQMKKAGLHIPVVFISGHGDIPMSVKAMKSGILKPFEDQDLLAPFSKVSPVTPLVVE